MEEGWIAFFHQLRRYVEERDSERRRTLYLTGAAPAHVASDTISGRLPGHD